MTHAVRYAQLVSFVREVQRVHQDETVNDCQSLAHEFQILGFRASEIIKTIEEHSCNADSPDSLNLHKCKCAKQKGHKHEHMGILSNGQAFIW